MTDHNQDLMFKAHVVALESGDTFSDGRERMVLRVEGCDSPSNCLRLVRPLFHGLMLDDEYEVILRPIPKGEEQIDRVLGGELGF